MSLTSYLAAPSRDFLLLPERVQGDFNKNADGSQAFSSIIGEKNGGAAGAVSNLPVREQFIVQRKSSVRHAETASTAGLLQIRWWGGKPGIRQRKR